MNPCNGAFASRHADAASGAILVFVVAYNAERHIRSVFERIPSEVFANPDVHFLVIDDASTDAGTVIISDWLESRGVQRVTVLRNAINQGYGGNQKLGFRYAIDGGFDFVVLLHGDGQYAPELLPRFFETWRETNADVVLGSRMRDAKKAKQGGMPVYKIAGNRMLTGLQNVLTGNQLSEYHTGYRGYSTRFLKSVPFEIDTNDFHFDTEILLQATACSAYVVEFDIPTHYGDEVCHVNGIRYAKDVILTTLRYWASKYGVLCSLKFRGLGDSVGIKLGVSPYTSQRKAADLVEKYAPGSLLYVGCAPEIIRRRCDDCRVAMEETAVNDLEAVQPGKEKVGAVGNGSSADVMGFGMVLMLDVVEHLSEPENLLVKLRNSSRMVAAIHDPPVFLISTPNVAFVGMRLNMLAGRFNYCDRGILHVMHRRLFTRSSLRRMLTDCGYQIETLEPLAVPFRRVFGGKLGAGLEKLSGALARLWPAMFAFQFLVACRPRPGVRQLLKYAEKHHGNDPSYAHILGQ